MAEPTASPSVILVCIGGPDNGKRLAISTQTVAIGRASTCEIASDDPDVAKEHINLHLDGHGHVQFIVAADSAAFVDGQRTTKGHLEHGQQLRIGRSVWQVQGGAGGPDISSFFGSIGERISEVAGVEKIEGFKPGEMFSEIWRKRTDEEMEEYFAVGTAGDTPKLADVDTNWPKPWLFFKTFILSALVYAGLVFAYNQFNNDNLIPGLLVIGSFVMPFTLLILFFEVNVLRNVPLYQVLKLLFLGGVLSLMVSLFLYQWTKAGQAQGWGGAFGAGFVEETGKAAALLLVLNKSKYRWTLNGMLFGAAVGAGFAGFESAGYAYTYGIANITTRAWLALLGGHVLWTALVGGALWRVRGDQKFDWNMLLDPRFLRVFVLAALMHAIWDSPLDWPMYLKYICLGFVVWVALLSYIQTGLRQVRAAQGMGGATEFFRKQKTEATHPPKK